jgi:hypothetical protein
MLLSTIIACIVCHLIGYGTAQAQQACVVKSTAPTAAKTVEIPCAVNGRVSGADGAEVPWGGRGSQAGMLGLSTYDGLVNEPQVCVCVCVCVCECVCAACVIAYGD